MFDVENIALLANLRLNENEKKVAQKNMEEILHFVETITQLNLDKYEAYTSSYDMPTVIREDVVGQTLSHEELEKNVPKLDENSILVPQVIQK